MGCQVGGCGVKEEVGVEEVWGRGGGCGSGRLRRRLGVSRRRYTEVEEEVEGLRRRFWGQGSKRLAVLDGGRGGGCGNQGGGNFRDGG